MSAKNKSASGMLAKNKSASGMSAKIAANEIRTHACTNQTFLLTYFEADLSFYDVPFSIFKLDMEAFIPR